MPQISQDNACTSVHRYPPLSERKGITRDKIDHWICSQIITMATIWHRVNEMMQIHFSGSMTPVHTRISTNVDSFASGPRWYTWLKFDGGDIKSWARGVGLTGLVGYKPIENKRNDRNLVRKSSDDIELKSWFKHDSWTQPKVKVKLWWKWFKTTQWKDKQTCWDVNSLYSWGMTNTQVITTWKTNVELRYMGWNMSVVQIKCTSIKSVLAVGILMVVFVCWQFSNSETEVSRLCWTLTAIQ